MPTHARTLTRSVVLAAATALGLLAPGAAIAPRASAAEAPPPASTGAGDGRTARQGGTTARQLCVVTDPALAQLSGLASRNGALYAVNDKSTVVHRLDDRCRVQQKVALQAAGTDIEDLAVAPDGALLLADIGGNRRPRSEVTLFRWDPVSGTANGKRAAPAQRFQLRYPDGVHDAEALAVAPSGQLLIVSKDPSGRSTAYSARLPLDPGAVTPLTPVARLDVSGWPLAAGTGGRLVTGAAVSPDGTHLALRTYAAAYEWDAPEGDLAAALKSPPRAVPLPPTRQGEAITYTADGLGLLTGTERLPAPVHLVPLARPAAAAAPATPGNSWFIATALLAAVALIVGLAAAARPGARGAGAPALRPR